MISVPPPPKTTAQQHAVWMETDVVEEDKKVCHKGYVSIFPLLLGLVPRDSPHLGALLDMISDPAHLWSDYGLRSLIKSDEYYSQGENYWRGPIWINMNYLALSSLYKVPTLFFPSLSFPSPMFSFSPVC